MRLSFHSFVHTINVLSLRPLKKLVLPLFHSLRVLFTYLATLALLFPSPAK
ncbi:unnamed protein product [Meloidogyne enterolobii]|uniref:Uncharacterized protein n=1 Tax=Meloidogyne enterolobii TaxID=390850 RepID=A0ACB1AT79_MELEN